MKKISIMILAIALGFLLVNFTIIKNSTPQDVKTEKPQYHVPENVQQIIDNSCFDCHNSGSDNAKGKKKLQFDKMSELKMYKQIGKLSDIVDVLNDDKMPPEKMVKKYPEIKLSKEQKETLINWAQNMSKQLMHTNK